MIIDIQRYWGESEIFYSAELASKIINSMQQHKKVVLISKEARSCTQSGLYQLLDELCSYWQWNPKDITIRTCNLFEKHQKYNIEKFIHFHWTTEMKNISAINTKWDGSKTYGMFLGRATAERIRGAVRHLAFEFRDQGLTSFHHDLAHHIDTPELLEYLCETDSRFSEVLAVKPYSDIGPVCNPPITGSMLYNNWENVYKKIALELVFETSTAEDNVTFSEKIIRPILHRRPFMLIAGRGAIKKLSDLEYLSSLFNENTPQQLIDEYWSSWSSLKFFENAFGTDYDNDSGVHRVDHVFDILHTMIRTGNIQKLHDQCQKDIEHNYNALIKFSTAMKKISALNESNFDRSTWPK